MQLVLLRRKRIPQYQDTYCGKQADGATGVNPERFSSAIGAVDICTVSKGVWQLVDCSQTRVVLTSRIQRSLYVSQ